VSCSQPHLFNANLAKPLACIACIETSIVLGAECRSASAALLIHRLGADNAKNLREWDRHVNQSINQ